LFGARDRSFDGEQRRVFVGLLPRPRELSSCLAGTVAAALRRTIVSLDNGIDFVNVQRLKDFIEPRLRPWRLGATIFGLLGGLVLVIAAVGLYGVVSYNTGRRMREIGIRSALGAAPLRIAALVVGQSVWMASIGLGIGFVVTIAGGRYLEPLLFAPRVNDPVVSVAVVAVLLLVAFVAGLLPAIRAMRVSPADALRTD